MTDKIRSQPIRTNFTHMFAETHAMEYGVNGALLLNKLIYYVRKNMGVPECTFEGRTYDRIPLKSWCRILPFLTADQIRHTLKKLSEAGVIVTTSELNKNWSDQSLWYGLADEAEFLGISQPIENNHVGKIPYADGKSSLPNWDNEKQPVDISQMGNPNCNWEKSQLPDGKNPNCIYKDSKNSLVKDYNPPISPLACAREGLSDFSDSDLEEGGDSAQSERDYFKAQQMGGRHEGYNHTKTPTSTPRNQTSQASGQNKRRKDLKATGPEVGEEWKEYCEGEKTTKLITPKNPDALPKACETLLEKGGIIWGQVGCGKTTVLRELAESHGKECIINWPEFYGQQLERIKTPPADKMFQAESFNDFLVSRPVLVIDEVALKNTTPSEVAMMYRIINGRYAVGKKTVLVTNYSPDRLRSDAGVGVQVFDRVTKGGVVVVCGWESLRGTQKTP